MSDRLFDVERFLADYAYLSEYLETARQKYIEGNRAVILMALHQCMLLKREPPEWLRLAFMEAYQTVAALKGESWDEVFDRPHEKGAHVDTRAKNAILAIEVAARVAARPKGKGASRSGIFQDIADDLHISAGKAEDLYYKYGGKELYETAQATLKEAQKKVLGNKE